MRYFFYGTLRDAEVRRAILGPGVDRVSIAPGVLPGWRCVFLRGRSYPVLRPDAAAATGGVIADGIDADQARRLDRFETDEYRPRRAAVRDADGETVEAMVFFAARPGFATMTPWRFDEWQRRHKPRLLRGWLKL
jgi:gamma-glutamylcyclotransferase (GGCT)/AIG2-like uncharacterized protein YtfP